MKRLFLACWVMSVVSGSMAGGAFAQNVCVVNDPTGTPLNVRSQPNGTILGALYNGTRVVIRNIEFDRSGQPWAYIVPLGAGKRGYVFRDYVNC